MYKDSLHPEGLGNSTSMLATCTPETCQHMFRCIMALGLWWCEMRGRGGKEGNSSERKKCMIFTCFTQLIKYSVTILTTWRNNFNTQITCVRALIGRHMASFATRMNPIATSSTLISDWLFGNMLLFDWLAPFVLTFKWKQSPKTLTASILSCKRKFELYSIFQ